MGAQNFKFDPEFPPNKSFSASTFAFFDEKFLTRRRFSDSPKFREGGLPQATTPLIALKYEAVPLPFVVSGAPAASDNGSSTVSCVTEYETGRRLGASSWLTWGGK